MHIRPTSTLTDEREWLVTFFSVFLYVCCPDVSEPSRGFCFQARRIDAGVVSRFDLRVPCTFHVLSSIYGACHGYVCRSHKSNIQDNRHAFPFSWLCSRDSVALVSAGKSSVANHGCTDH